MGRRGPMPKPDSKTQRGNRAIVALPGGLERKNPPPPAPKGLLKATQARWDTYWASDVANASQEVDHAALERLFRYYDEWQRAADGYAEQRVVSGSTGQPTVSPYFKVLKELEGAIHTLETDLGLTPMSRARLGIATGNAALTIAELNRMAEERDDRSDEDEALLGEWREAN